MKTVTHVLVSHIHKDYWDRETLTLLDRKFQIFIPDLLKSFVRFSYKNEQNSDINSQHYRSWKLFVWLCDKCENTVSMSIADRTSDNVCNSCKGIQFTVARRNQSLVDLDPECLSEWGFNKNLDVSPDEIAASSRTKVWWKCEKGHSELQSISSKVKMNVCRICLEPEQLHRARVNQIKRRGSLQDHFLDAARRWHLHKNGELTAKDVTTGAHNKVWRKCTKEHEWEMDINTITSKRNPYICPLCKNRKV